MLRILVVEDEEPTRRVTLRMLEGMGYQVCWAATGEGALELLRTEVVSVVLLDLGLPRISGYEVAGRMRLDPVLCTIPIIVLTGAAAEDIEAKIHNPLEGVVAVLGKPVNTEHLRILLQRLEEKK
jgi:CheY-like chemotaxis protein